MSDLQAELEAMRRDIDDLRARMQAAPPAPASGDTVDLAAGVLKRHLQQDMAEKGRTSGLSVASVVTQISGKGGSGTAFSVTTLTSASDLPSDDKIAETVSRLARFVQEPLLLRALRLLAEPHFEDRPMRRTKVDLAAALGVDAARVEQVLQPVLDDNELRWGKDASGEEFYEWSGNGLPMLLLIHG